MARLTHQDLCTLNAVLRQLYAPGDLATFPARALAVLAPIVPVDVRGYNEVNLRRQRLVAVTDPPDAHTPNDEQIVSQYLHEQPIVAAYTHTHDGRASMISDFLTPRQFHRLTLYNEFYRQRRTEDLMAIMLPAPASLAITYAFTRSRRTFSERDRLVLNLLRPHLAQAYHNAAALNQLRQELAQLQHPLEACAQGIILVTDTGRVRLMTERARQWAQAYFGTTSDPHTHRLLEPLWQWVRQQQLAVTTTGDVPAPRTPLMVEREETRLVVRLLTEQAEGEMLLLLEEHRTGFSPALLAPLAFTKRENDILSWLVRGKTNKEIAGLLGLSPHTIRTRLEGLYAKLGVTTRTAAAARILAVLGLH